MSLWALFDALPQTSAALRLDAVWSVNVLQPTVAYAAGVRLGDTLVSVADMPVAQSNAGPIQFLTHRAHTQKDGITITLQRSAVNDERREEWEDKHRTGQLYTYLTLAVWSPADAKDLEVSGIPTDMIPNDALLFSKVARKTLHTDQLNDVGTAGAGVRAVRKAYCLGLLALCTLDDTLAQAALPSGENGVLSFAPLDNLWDHFSGPNRISRDHMRYAHEITLAMLNVVFDKGSSEKVRLYPLSSFSSTQRPKASLYHNLMCLVVEHVARHDPFNLRVDLRHKRFTEKGKSCMVVVRGRVIHKSTGQPVTLGDLQDRHPSIVGRVLRIGDAPLPPAFISGRGDVGVIEAAFGGKATPSRILHMLSRNKVKWTKSCYEATMRLLRDDGAVDEALAWKNALSEHLGVDEGMLWYGRTTMNGQAMKHVITDDTSSKAAEFVPLAVRVVPEQDIKAILDRVYTQRSVCVTAGDCGAADIDVVTAKERKQSAKRSIGKSDGMVGMGINKMESYVRARYWGISRKHISEYLRNKEERQLQAPPFKSSGTVAGSLSIGQPVRVSSLAGVTFHRYEASIETQERQRKHGKAAAAYIKEGRSALPSKYSSRIYKVVTRYERPDIQPQHEHKVCRFWQGDSSFFGEGDNMRWWPTYSQIPPQVHRGITQEVCYGYVAFIDVYSKYVWVHPLTKRKRSKGKGDDLVWYLGSSSTLQSASACYAKAIKWCKEQYCRTHPPGALALSSRPSLVGGGRDGFPWANTHAQTDNGTEFSAAGAVRPLDSQGRVIVHFDLDAWNRSMFKDRLSTFQKHMHKMGTKSHGTSEPTISFRQQRDIETAHKGIKSKLYDIVHADPQKYNVYKLAQDTRRQVQLLEHAVNLYNHSPIAVCHKQEAHSNLHRLL